MQTHGTLKTLIVAAGTVLEVEGLAYISQPVGCTGEAEASKTSLSWWLQQI
jgi:hypothetical protein